MATTELEAKSNLVREITGRLQEERSKIVQLHEDLQAARQQEGTTQAAYDAAVRECYRGGSEAAEEGARTAWNAAKLRIDRLERIIPMLEESAAGLERELANAQWAEATEIERITLASIDALAEHICDKYEEIAAIGQQIRDALATAAPASTVLKRPLGDPQWIVSEKSRARQSRRQRPLVLYG